MNLSICYTSIVLPSGIGEYFNPVFITIVIFFSLSFMLRSNLSDVYYFRSWKMFFFFVIVEFFCQK